MARDTQAVMYEISGQGSDPSDAPGQTPSPYGPTTNHENRQDSTVVAEREPDPPGLGEREDAIGGSVLRGTPSRGRVAQLIYDTETQMGSLDVERVLWPAP